MPRNQSFMLTKKQYRDQTKNVTRRNGWAFAKVGDIVNGCEKCQGLKKGEKIVKMGQHRFVDLRWEPLRQMIDNPEYGKNEVVREGFPNMTPQEFVDMYCEHNKCTPETMVHRMKFEYLNAFTAANNACTGQREEHPLPVTQVR